VGGKYVKKYVASFIGIAPMSDPRLIVAVMLDEPNAGEHYGGVVAGPVFANVVANALRAMDVAPDSTVTNIVIPKEPVEESM
jgi:cell division protein FtsI (penicillin-binding protein 3)